MSEKIIIVSGGTGNLGKAVVEKLSSENYKIYLPVRSLDKFRKMYDNSTDENAEYAPRKIYALECDLSKYAEIKNFVDSVAGMENGRIDALVNLAGGIHPPVELSGIDEKFFDEYFKLNFESSLFLSTCVLKYMKENQNGSIIFTGALAGLKMMKGRYVYSAGKAALINLMESIALEMKQYNIRCNMVMPSVLDTKENREWASEEEASKFVSTSEVAEAIYGLLSEKNKSLNQTILKLTGNY